MRSYKALNNQEYSFKGHSIVPIRDQDKFDIMNWRNEQIHHLRQTEKLNEKLQNKYFKEVVSPLFKNEYPPQILFSFIKNNNCIGYGGLVHINWIDKNAEISFIMNTKLEKDNFISNWSVFLILIQKIAFDELKLNKIYTYAIDLRPKLYTALEFSGFKQETVLKKHCLIKNNFFDVVIHSKFNKNLNDFFDIDNCCNILISSISNKIPLIESLKNSISKISTKIKLIGGDVSTKLLGKYFIDEFWKMPLINDITIDEFIKDCKEKNISIIIPTRDGELEFFSKNKKKMNSNAIHVMVSDHNSIIKCLDKLKFSNNNNEYDKFFIPTFTSINNNINKRYVVKERFGSGSTSAGINLSKKQALEHSKLLKNPVFQPYINGYELSIDAYIDRNKKIKGLVMRKREIVVNGESKLTSTINNSLLENQFKSILNHLDLFGHVMLQAIIDSKKNIHIIECNPRFGGASTLSIKAGLDSFYWFYLESLKINYGNIQFKKSNENISQIRYSKDLYL